MPSHTVVAGDIAASCASLYSPTTEVSARDISGDVTAMHSVGRANFSRGPTSAQSPELSSSVGCALVSRPAVSGTLAPTIVSAPFSWLSHSSVGEYSGTSTGLQRNKALPLRLPTPRNPNPADKKPRIALNQSCAPNYASCRKISVLMRLVCTGFPICKRSQETVAAQFPEAHAALQA